MTKIAIFFETGGFSAVDLDFRTKYTLVFSYKKIQIFDPWMTKNPFFFFFFCSKII